MSKYQPRIRGDIETIENFPPNWQAVERAASVIPVTGTGNTSRKAVNPGSPKAATTTASCPGRFAATCSAVAYAPIIASNRVSIYATPNWAVKVVISVPEDALRTASACINSVTLGEIFGLTTKIFIRLQTFHKGERCPRPRTLAGTGRSQDRN